MFAAKLIAAFPDDPEMVRYYVRDLIAPRFFRCAKAEYMRHLPHGRFDLCRKSLELMRRFADLLPSQPGLRGLRRAAAFQILARPKLFTRLYPVLKRVA